MYTGIVTERHVTEQAEILADLPNLKLYQIAHVIKQDWSKQGNGVNYAAKPYLEAMNTLSSIEQPYYQDSGHSVVCYFLANAGTWRGETAKAVKKELKRRAGIK